jgi:hypothetical protein
MKNETRIYKYKNETISLVAPGHHYKEISIVVYLLYFQSGIIISLSELIFDLRINVVDIRKRDKNNKKNH